MLGGFHLKSSLHLIASISQTIQLCWHNINVLVSIMFCIYLYSFNNTILALTQCVGSHCAKKPVTTMLTYPWKCTVLHCNHLGNTWKPLVRMTRHFDYCPSTSEHGDNQSVRSSAPVVSSCFPGGYNVKLYISRGRLAWWLLASLHSERQCYANCKAHINQVVFSGL